MEWVILMAIVITYYSLDYRIKRINKPIKKEFPSLKELINKEVKIELNDEYDTIFTGILVNYDEKWISIEYKDKKGNIKQNYYRLSNIVAINIMEK